MEVKDKILRYKQLIKQAQQESWLLNAELANELASVAVSVKHIHPEFESRLAKGLQFGEYYIREDNKWACRTCGGNCGQCGNTNMLGNIGFSFDKLIDNLEPSEVEEKSFVLSYEKFLQELSLFLGALALIISAFVLWKLIWG